MAHKGSAPEAAHGFEQTGSAQGALAVGDHRLAERLLQRALLPANKDTARRAKAQAQLNTLQGAIRNRAAAPAALEAPSTSTER